MWHIFPDAVRSSSIAVSMSLPSVRTRGSTSTAPQANTSTGSSPSSQRAMSKSWMVKSRNSPEAIVLGSEDTSVLRGTVSKAAYLGTHMEYTIATPIGQLFVVDRDVARPIAIGSGVSIALAEHGVALVPDGGVAGD